MPYAVAATLRYAAAYAMLPLMLDAEDFSRHMLFRACPHVTPAAAMLPLLPLPARFIDASC